MAQKPYETELYRVMLQSGEYTPTEAKLAIAEMRERVANGEDPEEVLHEEGFEPDYVFDIIGD